MPKFPVAPPIEVEQITNLDEAIRVIKTLVRYVQELEAALNRE